MITSSTTAVLPRPASAQPATRPLSVADDCAARLTDVLAEHRETLGEQQDAWNASMRKSIQGAATEEEAVTAFELGRRAPERGLRAEAFGDLHAQTRQAIRLVGSMQRAEKRNADIPVKDAEEFEALLARVEHAGKIWRDTVVPVEENSEVSKVADRLADAKREMPAFDRAISSLAGASKSADRSSIAP